MAPEVWPVQANIYRDLRPGAYWLEEVSGVGCFGPLWDNYAWSLVRFGLRANLITTAQVTTEPGLSEVAMQCNCGGETTIKAHTVSTGAKKAEWLGREAANPLLIERNVCTGCGREAVRITDTMTGSLLLQRG
jgi:hypothetical protein